MPGWLSEAEGRTLAALAAGGLVLEIGSFHGRSTVCMAQAARRVHALDWHRGDAGSGWGWTLPDLLATLERHGLRERVVIHLGRSAAVGPALAAGAFDLVFVDGAHDWAAVRADLGLARRVAAPGGVIALHDWPLPAVREAAAAVLGWREDEPARVDGLAYQTV